MIEKVNPSHPDKLADRIAGAIVDICYERHPNPKVAVEVLLGHGRCNIILESSLDNAYLILAPEIFDAVKRISGIQEIRLDCYKQDDHLAKNQSGGIKCGDNGIFMALPLTEEEKTISQIARQIYKDCPYDGKYILSNDKLIICQSHEYTENNVTKLLEEYPIINWVKLNPLGYWTGGPNVDSGATNRKLGSDMGHSVTDGGLHGKDLSKADVSVNIYAGLKANQIKRPVRLFCAIGDKYIDGKPYQEIVEIARKYIKDIGGFEKFAEWGLF